MDLPVESWYQAIFVRRSRRSFEPVRIPDEAIARVNRVCQAFRPYRGVRAEFVDRSPGKIFRGILGSYGKITGALCYIALIGDSHESHVEEGIGYTGEGVILEATALGLETCWVSGFFRPAAVRGDLSLAADERVFAVTPLGRAKRELTAKDSFYRMAAGSNRRKSLDEIVEGKIFHPWQSKAVAAARLAPSASNRQPWRFILKSRSITVRTAARRNGQRFPRRLDCGIAMLHIELGARAAGVHGTWTSLPAPDVARFDPSEP
jgi:nitroreductase